MNKKMTLAEKQHIRTNKVKDYIRSLPAGKAIYTRDLIFAAGHTPETYGTGWSFVKTLLKRRVISKTPDVLDRRKTVWAVLDDVRTLKPVAVFPAPVAPAVEKKPKRKTETVVVVESNVASTIEKMAKDYYWETGNTDLKGFVAWARDVNGGVVGMLSPIKFVIGAIVLLPITLYASYRNDRARRRAAMLNDDGTAAQRQRAHDRGECPKWLGGYRCKGGENNLEGICHF
jgi:hypothetical protein